MTTNTHFVVVWDCDAAGKAETLRSELPSASMVTPFAFKKRQDNQIARTGIENAYDEEILEPFSIKKMDNKDTLLGRLFPKDHKTEFANHVLKHGTSEYFTHFQDLHDVVRHLIQDSPT